MAGHPQGLGVSQGLCSEVQRTPFEGEANEEPEGQEPTLPGCAPPEGGEGSQGLTSCALKAFLSVKSSSFHTTSTPSSVSMARKVLWMPGMFPWFTWGQVRLEGWHHLLHRQLTKNNNNLKNPFSFLWHRNGPSWPEQPGLPGECEWFMHRHTSSHFWEFRGCLATLWDVHCPHSSIAQPPPCHRHSRERFQND